MRKRCWVGIVAGIILGLIFIISGLGKVLYQAEFLASMLPKSLLTPLLASLVSYVLPAAELLLGLLLITGVAGRIAASLSALLSMAFAVYNSWLINHGLGYESCGCFGILEGMFKGELSTIEAFYIDLGMLALAVIMLLFYPGKFLTIRPWFLTRGKAANGNG